MNPYHAFDASVFCATCCHIALALSCIVAFTTTLPLSLQFESEDQFNSSVKTLLCRLPKQRYLKSICDEIHNFKITKKYVECLFCSVRSTLLLSEAPRCFEPDFNMVSVPTCS